MRTYCRRNRVKVIHLLAVFALFALFALPACHMQADVEYEINATAGLVLTYSGCNGLATATIDKDVVLKSQLLDKLRLDEANTQDILTTKAIMDSVTYSIDKSDHLKNGDTITVTVESNQDVLESYGISLVGSEKTFTVEGLKEPQELDLFADITVSYLGYAPFAKVSFTNLDQDKIKGVPILYSVDKIDMLKNNDTITVTAEVDTEALLMKGFTPKDLSKTYRVEGLDRLLMDAEEINDSALEWIDVKTSEVFYYNFSPDRVGIYNYFSRMWESAEESGDVELEKAYDDAFAIVSEWEEPLPTFSYPSSINLTDIYLLTPKSDMTWEDANNYVIFVYTVRIVDSVVGEKDLYVFFQYSEFIETSDGTQSLRTDDRDFLIPLFDKNVGYETHIVPRLADYDISQISLEETS